MTQRGILLGIVGFLGSLAAQDCPPVASISPNGTLPGALDAASCQLTDRTPYIAYRLDLPVRGQLKLELAGNPGDQFLTLRDSSGVRLDSGTSLLRPVEAGNYTLLVHGRGVGQTGNFAINSRFTAEAGIVCSNFPNIGRRQTVDGRLPGSGCTWPDGSPYEAYTLTTDGAGTISISVESADFKPLIAVRSLDGHSVATLAASPVNVRLLGDSQYLVIVMAEGGGGSAYRLTTSYTVADDETCRSTKTLSESDSEAGSITASSCFVTIPGSGDLRYYNYYNFTLTEPGLAAATVTSGDFSTTLNLLDGAGNEVAADSGSGGFDSAYNVQSSLRAQLAPGLYRLQVFSDLPSGGNYVLDYKFTAGKPQPCTPAILRAGDQMNGALINANCRTSLGMADMYTFTLPAAGTVELEMNSAAFDTLLAVRDSLDNLIVRDDHVNGLSSSRIAADLPAGDYTVLAAAVSGAGNYQLTAKFTAHEISACTYVQTLDLNGGFIQRLGPRSCTGANGQPIDYYGFTLSADSLVLAVMTSSEVDGYLTLYDAAGNMLRSDDSSYGGNDALLIQYLPAGTYKLGARAASSTVGGLYEVDLRTTAGSRPALCAPRATLQPGESANGVITYTACQASTDHAFADVYQLNVPADSNLDLRVDSSEFDAFLVLLDASGAVVDEDDDSGGNTNSRITRDLQAGTYYILVEPFGDYTAHGAYKLSVKTNP